MVGLRLFNFILCLLQVQSLQGQLDIWFDEPCELECDGRIHTYCANVTIPDCDNYTVFNLFDIKTMSDGKLLKFLVDAHNGIRDRIAKRMSVANMVKVAWDSTLADMVMAYFKQCTPYIDDSCTNFTTEMNRQELLEYSESDEGSYKYIAQNRYRVKADYLPNFFIENALRFWYYQKNDLDEPTYNATYYPDGVLGVLSRENNFTHLAHPLTANLGCGIAQIDDYFEMICNYFPYYRVPSGVVIFINGSETEACPSIFPLASEEFRSLCSDGEEYKQYSLSKAEPSLGFIGTTPCPILVIFAVIFFMFKSLHRILSKRGSE